MGSFDIILLALVAAFIILRLRSVLGSRDGNEGQRNHRDPFRGSDEIQAERDENDTNVVSFPDRTPVKTDEEAVLQTLETAPPVIEGPIGDGVRAIQAADQNFDPAGFLNGAAQAYEMIVSAFAKGDIETLKNLLDAEIFENFKQAIEDRLGRGESLENTMVGIRNVEISEASLEKAIAYVTVKVVSEQVNVTKDSEGRIIDGDPNQIERIVDLWTFMRETGSRNPNWFLVATETV